MYRFRDYTLGGIRNITLTCYNHRSNPILGSLISPGLGQSGASPPIQNEECVVSVAGDWVNKTISHPHGGASSQPEISETCREPR
jgi:hypothetical protein